MAEAYSFDEHWTNYFEDCESEKMLNSTKGREKLRTIWRKQDHRCPLCGERLTS